MTDAEKLEEILRVVAGVEHSHLTTGRPIPAHIKDLRRILGVPGVGEDDCEDCANALERAAQAEDKTAAGLAKLGLDQPLTDDPWGDRP